MEVPTLTNASCVAIKPNARTVHRRELRGSVRCANALLAGLEKAGLSLGNINIDDLERKAVDRTGLQDFGDMQYREPLEKLLENVSRSPALPLAKVSMKEQISQHLKNRLLIEDYLARHPEIRTIELDRPVFIVGLPRTGTTMVQNALSLSSECHSPEFWWLKYPVPGHPNLAKSKVERLRRGRLLASLNSFVAPEQASIHNTHARSLEECWHLFFNRFTSLSYAFGCGLHDYGRWLLQHDMEPTYTEYGDQLKLMSAQFPGQRLVLKCVEHVWFLDSLFKVFPNARVVWTHRDPFDSVASYASYISVFLRVMYGSCDQKKTGQFVEDLFSQGVTRAMAVRETLGKEDQILDVYCCDLVNKPVETIASISEKFDLPFQANDVGKLKSWLSSQRKDAAGNHRYVASDFGLNRQRTHTRFADYMDRFDVGSSSRGRGESLE